MSERERFYRERDQRTRQLTASALDGVYELPLVVRIGADAASHRAGQTAALALINLLARVHRKIHIEAPASRLLARPLVPAPDLATAMLATAEAIDPYGAFTLGVPRESAMSIGLGRQAGDCTIFAGAQGACATLDARATEIANDAMLGAALAACMAAATAFRVLILGDKSAVRRKVVSVWNVREDELAAPGPVITGPLDVGNVWMVGAGAVGCAVAYWLRELGTLGTWTVIDGDDVKLHNTNRGLLFLPAHTSWFGSQAQRKAPIVAGAFAAEPFPDWLHAWNATNAARPDLVLPVANEYGARDDIAALGMEIVLHATTSGLGTAQLHRHVAGVEGCISCRMRGSERPQFACSTTPLVVQEMAADAALPFVSATAGLLLVAAMYRLQQGAVFEERSNQLVLDLLSPHRAVQRLRRECVTGCASTLAPEIRNRLNQGRRWATIR